MQRDDDKPLRDLWKNEIAVRKEAQRWGALSNVGFIGLVATEIPDFIANENAGKRAWRLPLFFASSISIVSGVVMSWAKGNKAEKLRDTVLMIEHGLSGEQAANAAGQWSARMTAQKDAPQAMPSERSRNL